MIGTLTEEENGRTSLANGLRGFDFVKRANEAGVGIKVTSSSWGFYQVSKALDADGVQYVSQIDNGIAREAAS